MKSKQRYDYVFRYPEDKQKIDELIKDSNQYSIELQSVVQFNSKAEEYRNFAKSLAKHGRKWGINIIIADEKTMDRAVEKYHTHSEIKTIFIGLKSKTD